MSTLPQLRFPFTPPLPNDMPCDVPQSYGSDLNLPIPFPSISSIRGSHPLCARQRSIPDNTPSFSDTQQHPWLTNRLHYDFGVLSSVHGSWNTSHAQSVSAALSTTCSNDEWPGNDVTSLPCSDYDYDPGQNSHAAFDVPETSWSPSPNPPSSSSFVDDQAGSLHQFLRQLSLQPSNISSPAMHLHYPSPEPSILHPYPPHRSFNTTYFSPYTTSTGFRETDPPRSYPAHYRVPPQSSASLSRRRRSNARAIEYDGLWIDEEELVNGLMELDGKITIHPCRWEEDRSPCQIWIRGDESSINAHIQKWHRGKIGRDKSRVDCRWSTCGKTMRKDSIARHIVTKHLGEMWECQGCGKAIVRGDVYRQHAMRSHLDACRTLGAQITYSADAREIDACVALESPRR
ncbi:hypothetical protein V8E55_009254 [Tylopilus felleus]